MKAILSASLLLLTFCLAPFAGSSQTIHVLDFNDTHTGSSTDTTINVSIGDSIIILNHSTLDDDFEYSINGGAYMGAYNIAANEHIFDTLLLNSSITSVRVILYDPAYYRLVTLSYTATGINKAGPASNDLSAAPNPSVHHVKIGYVLPAGEPEGMIEIIDLAGRSISSHPVNDRSGELVLNTMGMKGTYIVSLKAGKAPVRSKKIIIE